MKRVYIDDLLSETFPDEETAADKTEKLFPEVSDEKTKRIIDSGLRKIREAQSGMSEDIKESRFVGAKINNDKERKKIRFIPLITAAACAVFCIVYAHGRLEKFDKAFSDDQKINRSDLISDNDSEGLHVVCNYPDFSSIKSPSYCDGKIIFKGSYSQRPYGVLRVYDPEKGQSDTVCFLSNIDGYYNEDESTLEILDFCLSDDGKYLYAIRRHYLIKYDISTGEIVKTAEFENVPEKISCAGNSSDMYVICNSYPSGIVYVINDQLEIKEEHVLPKYPDPETDIDYGEHYTCSSQVFDSDGCLYQLISYEDMSFDRKNGFLVSNGTDPESVIIVKYDSSFNVDYIIPNSELSRIDDKCIGLTVTRDGKAAVIGYHSQAGIISQYSPVIEKIYEMPEYSDRYGITFDTDICDFVQYTDTEMKLWNIGDSAPAAVYRNIVGKDSMFSSRLPDICYENDGFSNSCKKYHFSDNKLYYIASAPEGEYVTADTNGSVYKRCYDYSFVPSHISRSGDVYYSVMNSKKALFMRSSENEPEIISEYDCDSVDIYHNNSIMNVDINILSHCVNASFFKSTYELHSSDGRKICDFELPGSKNEWILTSRSTDNGEEIYYVADDMKAYCYNTVTKQCIEMKKLNDNVIFTDENSAHKQEKEGRCAVYSYNKIFSGEKYDICFESENRLFGYDIDSDEFSVLADDLDSYGLKFNGFTVSEDGTVYCTLYEDNKLYKIVQK